MMRVWILLVSMGLTAAEGQRVVLMQELIRLEAMEKKTIVMFPLEQQGAQLEVKFASQRGGEGVRVAVYTKGSTAALAGTTYELTDTLRLPLEREREYRVEMENMRQRLGHALVDTEVTLVFGGRPEPPPSAARELDPQQRFYTIATSLSVFAMVFGYAAIRLTPPVLQRWRGER